MNADMKKRILLTVAGMNILAIGIILNTKSMLGVGAINTVPYTAAEIAGVSLGTTTVILYFLFIGAQCILTRKADITAFLQLPFSFLFGAVINLYDAVIRIMPVSITGKLLILCGRTVGIGIGTLLSALLIGRFISVFQRVFTSGQHTEIDE